MTGGVACMHARDLKMTNPIGRISVKVGKYKRCHYCKPPLMIIRV